MKRAPGLASLLALVFACFTAPVQASAVLLLQRLSPATMAAGDSALFELRVSGLSDVLGAFSADIAFDGGVLAFSPAASLAQQFGSRLGDPLTETLGAALPSGPGLLHLDQVSLLSSTGLDALQRDNSGQLLSDFVLAQISFTGLASGFSLLELVPASVVLSDSAGAALPAPLFGGSGVAVVSEPTSAGLVALALLLLWPGSRRRTWLATQSSRHALRRRPRQLLLRESLALA